MEEHDVAIEQSTLVELTADVVSAYVSKNAVVATEISALIGSVHQALAAAATRGRAPIREELKPAVPIKKSVTLDYIICLEDGKQFKSLKRHLSTHYDLSPDAYRSRWGLPHDYPMVAPNYAAARSLLAKKIGLGRPQGKPAGRPARAKA